MILSGTRPILICSHNLPFFELYVKVLTCFPHDVDKRDVVVDKSVLIFSSETKNSLHLDSTSEDWLNFVRIDDFVVRNQLIGIGLILYCKNQRVQKISSCETHEIDVFTELLFVIKTSTDHEGASEEGGSVVFETDSSSPPQPLALLQIEHQQICIEPFTFLSFKTDSSHNHHVVLIYFERMKARRDLRRFTLDMNLNPFSPLFVVFVEHRQSIHAGLMVASQQVHLLLPTHQRWTIPDGRKQRIETSIEERGESELQLKFRLLSFGRRRFNDHLALVLLLPLGDLFLFEFFPGEVHLILEVTAEGTVESPVIVLHGLLHVCLALFHLPHDAGEGDMLRLLPLPPEGGGLLEYLFD